jgi:hypothetical protein
MTLNNSTMQVVDFPLERSNIPVFNMMLQQFSNLHALYNSIYTATTIVQVDLYAKAQKVSIFLISPVHIYFMLRL